MKATVLAATLLLAVPAYADPAPAPAIQLAVTGDIDTASIASSVATELARPVTPIAASEACRAPCLAIAVAGTTATVTFTTSTGGTRQRAIELGRDRAQWREMVTLLAGNLVRDDAADLLAEPAAVPMPMPMPMPVPVPVPVPMPFRSPPQPLPPPLFRAHASFAISFVPGLSTDLLDLDRTHSLSIGVISGVSGEVDGMAVSGVVDVAGVVRGAQLAGAVTVAHDLIGVQIAGAIAIADHSTGAQVAGAVAIAHDSHAQIAGAVAIADSTDVQISGAVSVATIARTQVAGAVNVATHVLGLQLAPVNIAQRNDGVQIGVINIGGGPNGDSFGLINIVPGGRTELEATVDSDRIGTLMLRHGGRHWHNVYGVGGQSISTPTGSPTDDIWMFGLGIGPSFHVAGMPVDVEAIAWQVNHGGHYDEQVSLLNQLRLTVGVPIGPVTLVAGGAINAYVSNDRSSPLMTARTTGGGDPGSSSTNSDVTVHVWPSLFVGARL